MVMRSASRPRSGCHPPGEYASPGSYLARCEPLHASPSRKRPVAAGRRVSNSETPTAFTACSMALLWRKACGSVSASVRLCQTRAVRLKVATISPWWPALESRHDGPCRNTGRWAHAGANQGLGRVALRSYRLHDFQPVLESRLSPYGDVSGCDGRLRSDDFRGMNPALYLAELHREIRFNRHVVPGTRGLAPRLPISRDRLSHVTALSRVTHAMVRYVSCDVLGVGASFSTQDFSHCAKQLRAPQWASRSWCAAEKENVNKPIPPSPDLQAQLDGAFQSKATAEAQRLTAEADRKAKLQATLVESARILEMVVRPGLEGLVEYLKQKHISAEVQSQVTNGHTTQLRLVWGRAVRSTTTRAAQAHQNTFRVTMKPEGSFIVDSALLHEDFVSHTPVPDPIATEWVQAEAVKTITRSVTSLTP